MRLPNGYGSVIKLKGKRRKPYAVRTSEISEFVEIDAPKEPPSKLALETDEQIRQEIQGSIAKFQMAMEKTGLVCHLIGTSVVIR